MSAALVLGLWLGDGGSSKARCEAWRTLLAARAGGMGVRVLDLRPAPPAPPGPPEAPNLPDSESRLLDLLAAEGAPLEVPNPDGLRSALSDSTSVVAVADPQREGTPPLLLVDEAFLRSSPASMAARLRAAGQIARA